MTTNTCSHDAISSQAKIPDDHGTCATCAARDVDLWYCPTCDTYYCSKCYIQHGSGD